MAGTFSSSEAKRLTAGHNLIYSKLCGIINSEQYLCDEIRKAVKGCMDSSAMAMLYDIPVEDISKDVKGVRIKNLSSAGIDSVGRLLTVSPRELDAVEGIGPESVKLLKSAATELFYIAEKDTKIKLSLDNSDPASAALMRAVYIMRSFISDKQEAENLINFYNSELKQAINDILPVSKTFGRMFLSAQKKEKAQYAYNYLLEAMNGRYGISAKTITARAEKTSSVPDEFIRGDFAAYSVQYINIIEKICPGVIGTGDGAGGLPGEIAKAISEEPLYLEGLGCTLRHYQEWGVKYILHQKRVLLGDEMGLGKTVQAIAAMVSLYNCGASHFAVVCPASVLTNWCREIKKFCSVPVTEVHGSDRGEELSGWIKTGGIAVTTYETSRALTLPGNMKINMLTVDEAHYIKNPSAKRTNAVKELCAKAENILFMTGTALENRVDEMRNLIGILNPETAAAIGGMEALSSAPVFRKKIAPVYFRRRREDVLTELPELIENEDWCRLNPTEESAYEDAVLSGNFAAMRRVSWNVDDIGCSSKAMRLKEIIEDAKEDGRKVIVFSFFLDTVEKVRSLPGISSLPAINGSVSPDERQKIVDDFAAAPAGTVLAAQIIAGGTGLNIQAASVVVICEPQFKPSLENQAISRAYRMGQVRNVLVHRLLCEDTADERIRDILTGKQAVFDAFADESDVAKESVEIDNTNINAIIEQEKQRIENKKREAQAT